MTTRSRSLISFVGNGYGDAYSSSRPRIPRGRLWLADEVRDLLAAKVSRADLAKVIEAKLMLDGFVADKDRDVA